MNTSRKRSWSSPAATVAHLRGRGNPFLQKQEVKAAVVVKNVRVPLPLTTRLFPPLVGEIPPAVPPGAPPTDSGATVETLRSELETARSQIQLFNYTNEQTLAGYSQLDEENKKLKMESKVLKEENEKLKVLLDKAKAEVDEQFSIICELQQTIQRLQSLT
ncbi:hypothetical protein AGDE_00649 [Angomonas deanei]|uniref:Uncharacterized protein n=1 Tax=Angomonas deanei TaxID=59799 RepID=A0A7G2CSE6_9TRYP|nr:hypothetical protein AGDE_00649 [Angomonas deanei]CAD2222726.1 hypothetical protein, conserved [Angomonas deanei]|eukprot:EPY43273.1 hypothetical protein AGDE_00649 [Angomonas deanei]